MDADTMRSAPVLRIEHKHGLDEWSPMLPERSAQSVVLGEQPPDDVFRCQRIGCTEVIRLTRDEDRQRAGGGGTVGGRPMAR
jgi:hypothetical protein